MDPASMMNQVAAATGGTRTGSTDDAKFTWQGIMHEGAMPDALHPALTTRARADSIFSVADAASGGCTGHFGSLRCDESLIGTLQLRCSAWRV
jgi:hypothetical protein